MYNDRMAKSCNAFHEIECRMCPNCGKPLAVLRGLDADCKPIAMRTHRVNLKSFRLGVFAIPE